MNEISPESQKHKNADDMRTEDALANFITLLQDQAMKGKLVCQSGRYQYDLAGGKNQTVKMDIPVFDGSVHLKNLTMGSNEQGVAGRISFTLTEGENETRIENVHGLKIVAARDVCGIGVSRQAKFQSFIIPKDSNKPISASLDNPIRLKAVRKVLGLNGDVITYQIKQSGQAQIDSLLPKLAIE